jgi:hypothetical protein
MNGASARDDEEERPTGRRRITPLMVLLIGLAVLMTGHAMTKGMNHDEHQFVAPAVLMADDQLMPYRDFPLFHIPYVSYLYSVSYKIADDAFLGARLATAMFGWLAVALVAVYAWRALGGYSRWGALALGLLLPFSTVFANASGRSWNHNVPAAFALGSLWVLFAARSSKFRNTLFVVAGVLAGVAVGARLTYATFCGVLVIGVLMLRELTLGKRAVGVAAVLAGLGLALLPVAWLAAHDPQAFWFCNFEFPRAVLRDPMQEHLLPTLTLLGKIGFILEKILLRDIAIYGLLVVIATGTLRRAVNERQLSWPVAVSLLALPFALLGCLTPPRYHDQHFFALPPFGVIAIATMLAEWPRSGIGRKRIMQLVIAVSLITVAAQARRYGHLEDLFSPEDWEPAKVRRLGEKIAEETRPGRILTFAPIQVLEGARKIYPELATGLFAWRAAPLLTEAEREQTEIFGAADIEALVRDDPPAGVLVGFEDKFDPVLSNYARRNGFLPVKMGEVTLWVAPPNQ